MAAMVVMMVLLLQVHMRRPLLMLLFFFHISQRDSTNRLMIDSSPQVDLHIRAINLGVIIIISKDCDCKTAIQSKPHDKVASLHRRRSDQACPAPITCEAVEGSRNKR